METRDVGELAPKVRAVLEQIAPALAPIVEVIAPAQLTASRERIAGPGRIASAADLARVRFRLEVKREHCEDGTIEAVVAHEVGEIVTFILFGETPGEGMNAALELQRELVADRFAVALLSHGGLTDGLSYYIQVLGAQSPAGEDARSQLARRLAVLRGSS